MARTYVDEDWQSRSVLGRAAAIINLFMQGEPVLSLHELTERTGLPRSTVHRFAEQLVAIGWLERVVSGYRVGMQLFELGGLVTSLNRLRNAAGPWLHKAHELSRQSVHLGVLDGAEVVYVDKVTARGANLPTRMGGRMPANCTALGKAMLAYLDERDLESLIARGLGAARTPHTVVCPSTFRESLQQVRDTGVALDREEAVRGIVCVAAPIRGSGRAIAAISITGPRDGFDLRRFASTVKSAADGIWSEMFGSKPVSAGVRHADLLETFEAPRDRPAALLGWSLQPQPEDWY